MDAKDFEGTLILEKLAEIGQVDIFFEAIDSDDFEKVRSLLRLAKIDVQDIHIVLNKMKEASGE